MIKLMLHPRNTRYVLSYIYPKSNFCQGGFKLFLARASAWDRLHARARLGEWLGGHALGRQEAGGLQALASETDGVGGDALAVIEESRKGPMVKRGGKNKLGN
jgi:hypothetical protein